MADRWTEGKVGAEAAALLLSAALPRLGQFPDQARSAHDGQAALQSSNARPQARGLLQHALAQHGARQASSLCRVYDTGSVRLRSEPRPACMLAA